MPRDRLQNTVVYLPIAQQHLYTIHCFLLTAIPPKSPTGIPPFLLFQGLCLQRLWSVSPSSLWLSFHGVYSPTAPVAPSLKPLVQSDSLIGCQSVQVCHHHLPLVGAAKSSNSDHCSHIYSSYCVPSLLQFQRGPTPPECPVIHFPQSNESANYLLCDLQLYGLPEDSAECFPASLTWLLSLVVASCPLLPQT
jgi:hypothetical protein